MPTTPVAQRERLSLDVSNLGIAMTLRKVKNVLRSNKGIEAGAYLLQNWVLSRVLNFAGEGSFDTTIAGLYEHGVKISDQYRANTPIDLHNKSVLEIGSGLSLVTIYHLVQQSKIETAYAYDWFACRHKNDARAIEETGLQPYANRVAYVTGDYQILANAIPPASLDWVFSNAVLEHVRNLDALIDVLARALKPGGGMYHRVDLRCHNRFRGHGELFFHTFSRKMWDAMGCNVGQPNRWLLKDYLALFAAKGFTVGLSNVQRFPDDVLEQAKIYLPNAPISDYETAVFDVVLRKK